MSNGIKTSATQMDGYWVANVWLSDGSFLSGIGATRNAAILNCLSKDPIGGPREAVAKGAA